MSTLFDVIIGGPEGVYSYLLELPLIATPGSGGGTLGMAGGALPGGGAGMASRLGSLFGRV